MSKKKIVPEFRLKLSKRGHKLRAKFYAEAYEFHKTSSKEDDYDRGLCAALDAGSGGSQKDEVLKTELADAIGFDLVVYYENQTGDYWPVFSPQHTKAGHEQRLELLKAAADYHRRCAKR